MFFLDFQNWSHCCRSPMFFGSSLPKTRRSFHIPKITGALTIINYFLKLANSFILLPRTIIKKTLELIFFSSIFLGPQTSQGTHFFQVPPLKMLNQKFICSFQGYRQNFLKPCATKVGNSRWLYFGIGFLEQLGKCPIFFSKVTPP